VNVNAWSKVVGSVIAAAALGVAAPASAGAGNGIRFGGGDARLHPFLDLEGRYDSNVRFTGTSETSDFIAHIRPGVRFDAPGDVAAVKFSGAVDFAQYLEESDLSTVFAEADLGLSFNRRGQIGLEITDEFRRRDGSTALSISSAVISNYNALGVEVPIQPGGGALLLKLTGGWVLESFECPPGDDGCVSSVLSDLGYDQFSGGGQIRWKFLPRTAAVVEGNYFTRRSNGDAIPDVGGVRVLAGISGLLTTHWAGQVKAGYGSVDGDGTLAATVELEWLPTETASLLVGYVRDVGAEPTLTFASNRGYAEARAQLGGRYELRLLGSYTDVDYFGASSATLLRVEPGVDVNVARWLKLGVAYAYTDRTAEGTGPAGFEFSKQEAWLRASLTY
jgi:hypothetical protein